MPELIRALRHRNYRIYFAGQLISLVGTWMQQVAMSWLAYRLTGSALVLGLVAFAGQLPVLLLAPVGGLLCDRFDRRRLLMLTQALALTQALLLAAVTLAGSVQPGHLMALALILGIINAVDMPARQSLAVRLVDEPADLPNAIALNSFSMNAGRLVGPAAAGVMVAWVGEGICFLLNAASYLAVLLALLWIKLPALDRRAGGRGLGLTEGLAYASAHPAIGRTLLLIAAMGLLITPYTVLMPLYAREVFGGDAGTLGLLLGCAGLGALLAAVRLAFQREAQALPATIRNAAFTAALGLALFSHAASLWVAVPALLAVGFGVIGTVSTGNTLIQMVVEDRLRGRVMALFTMSFMGIAPIGALAAGALAEQFGVARLLLMNGLLALAATFWLARVQVELPTRA